MLAAVIGAVSVSLPFGDQGPHLGAVAVIPAVAGALAGALLAAGCATPEAKPARPIPLVMESRANLLLALQRCSDDHGYDPASTQVAENALAPGELGWRECAYAALRVHALSNPELRQQYERLIEEDQRMTAAISAGTASSAWRAACSV